MEHKIRNAFELVLLKEKELLFCENSADVPRLAENLHSAINRVTSVWKLEPLVLTLERLCSLKQNVRSWVRDCLARAEALLECLLEVFRFHKVGSTEDEATSFFGKYLLAALADCSEDFFKYQTNWIACRLLRQAEYPERPTTLPLSEKDGFLMGTAYRDLMHKRWRYNRRCSLAYDLIMCKRGAKPVSILKRLAAIGKHGNNLSREATPLSDDGKLVRTRMRGLIRTIYGEVTDRNLYLPIEKVKAPSTSSTYTHNRSQLGGLLPIKESFKIDPCNHCTRGNPLRNILDCGCHRWIIGDVKYVVGRGFPFDYPEEPALWEETPMYSTEYGFSQDRLRSDKKHILGLCEEEDNASKVHLVLEPMKVRTITAGSARLNYLGMYWQKWLHNIVGKFPSFEYTHSPASFNTMRAALGRLPFGELLVSGDYEAATDNMHPELTREVWYELSNYLVPNHRLDEAGRRVPLSKEDIVEEHRLLVEIGNRMLFGQVLEYDLALEKILEKPPTEEQLQWLHENFGVRTKVVQTFGQLMGCILSFFILCIINLGTVVCAFEETRARPLSDGEIRNLPVRINGDDVAFRATEDTINSWKRFARSVGLKPSLGKNFVSDEFIMINSEMYIMSEDWERRQGDTGYHFTRNPSLYGDECKYYYRNLRKFAPYMNLGLLRGQGRVQEDTRVDQKFLNGTDTYKSIGARAHALVRGFSTKKSTHLIERLIYFNMATLESTKKSWNIPEELGGLGIPLIQSDYSTSGLVVAAYLDRLAPDDYAQWMSRIKATELNPPGFVKKSLALTGAIQRFFAGESEWMSREEAKKFELPMVTGLTFLVEDYRPVEREDRKVSAEAAYRELYHTAIRSGVKAKTPEQVAAIWDHKREDMVRAYRLPEDLKHQLVNWVPNISSGFFTTDWRHPTQ